MIYRAEEVRERFARRGLSFDPTVEEIVRGILAAVREEGDAALDRFSLDLDGHPVEEIPKKAWRQAYEDLDEALAPLRTRQLHSLVLDLSGLDYISSAGIRSIFKARKTLAPHGGKVLLVNPQPQIQKVLDMVKAVPLNEIFSSTAEADAYLDLMQRRVLEAGEDED